MSTTGGMLDAIKVAALEDHDTHLLLDAMWLTNDLDRHGRLDDPLGILSGVILQLMFFRMQRLLREKTMVLG